jgi:hypothetical protein
MDGSTRAQATTARSLAWVPDKRWEFLIREEFQNSAYGALRLVSCQVDEGLITLSGSVPSYYLKQVAQWHAQNAVSHAAVIVNQLRVEP